MNTVFTPAVIKSMYESTMVPLLWPLCVFTQTITTVPEAVWMLHSYIPAPQEVNGAGVTVSGMK